MYDEHSSGEPSGVPKPGFDRPTDRLIQAVQDLSLARELGQVMEIVRRAARDLTGADGAAFVLREGELCHYADEDAIQPLWKGRKFPLTSCISGWAMLNRRSVAVEDIYADPRIPHDAYRPTFVRSLAIVPIRTAAPVGAIGNYWARPHRPTAEELRLLQALADSTSIAMENVQLYGDLERRVQERTAQLAAANRELESFSYSVSHDLRAPLRAISGFSTALVEDHGAQLNPEMRHLLDRVVASAGHMNQLIDDLLGLARVTRHQLMVVPVDVSALVRSVCAEVASHDPDRRVTVVVADGMTAVADRGLLRVALDNLIGNAWKFTGRAADARIAVDCVSLDGAPVYRVRDNGAGFDMAQADRLFGPFQRLHHQRDFPGTGIGLATVQRVIQRHGGRVWAESVVGQGATFSFTLAAPGA